MIPWVYMALRVFELPPALVVVRLLSTRQCFCSAKAQLRDSRHRVAVDHIRLPFAKRLAEAGDEGIAALAVERVFQ